MAVPLEDPLLKLSQAVFADTHRPCDVWEFLVCTQCTGGRECEKVLNCTYLITLTGLSKMCHRVPIIPTAHCYFVCLAQWAIVYVRSTDRLMVVGGWSIVSTIFWVNAAIMFMTNLYRIAIAYLSSLTMWSKIDGRKRTLRYTVQRYTCLVNGIKFPWISWKCKQYKFCFVGVTKNVK